VASPWVATAAEVTAIRRKVERWIPQVVLHVWMFHHQCTRLNYQAVPGMFSHQRARVFFLV
jgi:hypothetical protein